MSPRMSVRLLITALLASMAVTLLPAPAHASAAFQFTGRGWGHGVGMAQYGALELAKDGSSAENIIAHYYQGATAAKPSLDLDEIFVGLSQNVASVTATAVGAPITVRFADEDWDVPKDGTATIQFLSSGHCRLRINGSNTATNPTCTADLTPGAGASIALSNESVVYSHDRITRVRIRPRPDDHEVFHVTAELPNVETYLLGLREVPASWPAEALRAQAIAARSFAAYDLLADNSYDATTCHCDLYDSVKSQVYGGSTGETEAWRQAVSSTTGQVVWSPGATGTRGGGVVQAFYSSSSWGRTEAIEDSSAFASGPRPYFTSVDDPWSLRSSNPYASWVIDVPEAAIRTKLGFDDVTSIKVTARNQSGSARQVAFTGRRGSSTVTTTTTGDQLRGLFGLRSGYIASVFLPPFSDDDGNIHESAIAWLAGQDITKGCNPPVNDHYCPDGPVTRAQMASFLTRAKNLTPQDEPFVDVDASNVHAQDIGALAAAGITKGCNPPDNDRFCPDAPVTRQEMASFLTRALELTQQDEPFTDVDSSNVHAQDIGALAATGITKGCNPPANDHYCPGDPVTRAQMASFLHRGMG